MDTENNQAADPDVSPLITMIRDLVRAFERALNDAGSPIKDSQEDSAWAGIYSAARSTAFAPIRTSVKALAQAILISHELDTVLEHFKDEEDKLPDDVKSAVAVLQARPVLLARWLESEFNVDRKDYELDFFGDDEMEHRAHLPHLVS